MLEKAKFTHLKVYADKHVSIDQEISKRFFNQILDYQTESIRDLKLRGVQFQGFPIDVIINNCKQMHTLELDLGELRESWDILNAIKGHKREGYWKNWSSLTFENFTIEYKKIIDDILANHEGILTLTLKQAWIRKSIFNLKNQHYLKAIQYKFPDDNSRRSYNDFAHSTFIETFWFDTENEIMLFAKFLKRCTNLEVLKFNPGKVTLTPSIIETILLTVSHLEELHFVFNCGYPPEIVKIFEVIKNNGNIPKKLVVGVRFWEVDDVREKIKIFNDIPIQTVVLMVPAAVGNPQWLASCTWKK